jgi:DNA polymerase III delta prime subunit
MENTDTDKKHKAMTIDEICAKAGCTKEDIVRAMVEESKNNVQLHTAARKERLAMASKIEAEFRALEVENKRLHLLIENDRLSNEWTAISERILQKAQRLPQELELEK